MAPARTGDVNDLVTGGRIDTFTNSSPAWGWSSGGLLVQSSANTPFVEYDPATSTPLGLRIWGIVLNLSLHSRDLTQTAWVKSGITPTRDQVGADGTANTATRLTATSSDGTALQTITSASATRVSGFLIKRITGTGVIQITQDGGATWNTVSITNQWLRYSIAAATVTNPQIGFRIRSSGDEIAVDFAQLQSSSVLGPPVATAGVSASSTADVMTISGSAFSKIWNPGAVTIVAELARGYAGNFAGYDTAYHLSDGTIANSIAVYGTQGGDQITNFSITADSVTQTDYVGRGHATTAPFKLVQALSANDSVLGTDRVLTTRDTSVTMPSGINRINIGSGLNGGSPWTGYIREFVIFNSRRPNLPPLIS